MQRKWSTVGLIKNFVDNHPNIFSAIIIGLIIIAIVAFVGANKIMIANKTKTEFYLEGDKEVTRFYYDGYINIKVNNNSFTIEFEDLDEVDFENIEQNW